MEEPTAAVPAVDLLRIREVQALTTIPVSTLRYLRAEGKGPRSFKLGGRIVYKRQDVLDWVQQQYDAGAPEAATA